MASSQLRRVVELANGRARFFKCLRFLPLLNPLSGKGLTGT